MSKKRLGASTNVPSVQPPPMRIGGTVIAPAAVFHVPSRRPFGNGPWHDEYEKVSWVDEATGLNCIILRQRDGTLSGYVGISSKHPLFGYAHEAVPDAFGLHVHGGLTYSSLCEAIAPEPISVCHVPTRPAKPQLILAPRSIEEEVWWFGFDTNHDTDMVPNSSKRPLRESGEIYRDQLFVYRECVGVTAGLAGITRGSIIPKLTCPDLAGEVPWQRKRSF